MQKNIFYLPGFLQALPFFINVFPYYTFILSVRRRWPLLLTLFIRNKPKNLSLPQQWRWVFSGYQTLWARVIKFGGYSRLNDCMHESRGFYIPAFGVRCIVLLRHCEICRREPCTLSFMDVHTVRFDLLLAKTRLFLSHVPLAVPTTAYFVALRHYRTFVVLWKKVNLTCIIPQDCPHQTNGSIGRLFQHFNILLKSDLELLLSCEDWCLANHSPLNTGLSLKIHYTQRPVLTF